MPQIEHFTKELYLPGPIASYLRAVNTGAKEEFPASFADDAVVVDVNREVRGLDAITAWAGADTIEAIERDAPQLDGAGDRFSGYAIIGLSFQSGHILALRRFSASSIGPGYTSVWHRDPSGSWTFYSTVAPDLSCARYFGGQVERNVVTPIDIAWADSRRFRVAVGNVIEWHVALGTSAATWLLNTVARAIPERAWQSPAVLRLMGDAAQVTLGTGRMNFTGLTPNGHRFIGNPRRVWLIESSHALVQGVRVGPLGPLTDGTLRRPSSMRRRQLTCRCFRPHVVWGCTGLRMKASTCSRMPGAHQTHRR